MNTDGHFYSQKKIGYSEELKNCIEKACQCCLDDINKPDTEKINRPVLMLGKIQSGKTRAYTGLIALAFDNGFDMVFILSKNTKALINQTVSRMRKEFKGFLDDDEIRVSDIMKCRSKMSPFELKERKNIIVAKKEKNNIKGLREFIRDNSIKEEKCLIIDDEADATGIGYNKESGKDEYTLRTIASQINELRGNLNGCALVQVTATPYALYLQPEKFSEDSGIFPVKPLATVLVHPGKDYIGGDYYFIKSKEESHPASALFEKIDQREHEYVSDQKNNGKKAKIDDRRRIKDEDILSDNFPLKVFKKGIINFFIGAIVLNYNNIGGSETERCPYCGNVIVKKRKINRFAYGVHTATQKNSHSRLAEIAINFLDKIKEGLVHDDERIEKLLKASYEDIEKSVKKHDELKMPSLDEVKLRFFDDIKNGRYRVDTVNSESKLGAENLLNEETGELDLRVPYSIFVGGNILDRGVTIPNMIGFYYGRNPEKMQQDTVLQHSRMFGYRKKLLPVTRFYTTERIHSNMEKMTECDNALWTDIENGAQGNGIYFITQNEREDIIPCSPKKILPFATQSLFPGTRILPVGFSPISKREFEKIDRKIEKILQEHLIEGDEKDVSSLNKSEFKELLSLVYQTIKDDNNERDGFVSFDEMMRYFSVIGKEEAYCAVFRNRDNAKYRADGRLHDSPFTSQGSEDSKIKHFAKDYPCLALYKEKGVKDGWDGKPFWWPVLVVPQSAPKRVFALKTVDQKVSATSD